MISHCFVTGAQNLFLWGQIPQSQKHPSPTSLSYKSPLFCSEPMPNNLLVPGHGQQHPDMSLERWYGQSRSQEPGDFRLDLA